ncbi:unnamed protein product [Closterium sp. NIES-64]|nr:unnamed protein product [Closterium sp. NIES-64]
MRANESTCVVGRKVMRRKRGSDGGRSGAAAASRAHPPPKSPAFHTFHLPPLPPFPPNPSTSPLFSRSHSSPPCPFYQCISFRTSGGAGALPRMPRGQVPFVDAGEQACSRAPMNRMHITATSRTSLSRSSPPLSPLSPDPWLQEATGSEPLSLEEEYSMQQRWRDDSDKCTFILLDRSHIPVLANTSGELPGATTGPSLGAPPETAAAAAAAAVEGAAAAEGDAVGCLRHSPSHLDGMCGDVNLFLNDPDHPTAAEVEVMIADPTCRGRGLGREALQLMLAYAAWHLHVTTFRAKINDSNAPSLALFRSLGFVQTGHSQVFQQTSFELAVHSPSMAVIQDLVMPLHILKAVSMASRREELKTGPQLGQTQEQAERAHEKIVEGGKKGGEARKAQMTHEDYVEMGRKGGKARAEQAYEGAQFAGHPEGALRDVPEKPIHD